MSLHCPRAISLSQTTMQAQGLFHNLFDIRAIGRTPPTLIFSACIPPLLDIEMAGSNDQAGSTAACRNLSLEGGRRALIGEMSSPSGIRLKA